MGSGAISQTVYETNQQYFSQIDLATFQVKNKVVVQPAVDYSGGKWTTTQCASSSIDCSEGNLDIQYIMGVSQLTTSIYWYDDAADPLSSWIKTVASQKSPPSVISISYGIVEQAVDAGIMSHWNTQAAKLGLMGTTIVASSGDNGAANVFATSAASAPTCQCNSDSSSASSLWTGGGWGGKGYFPSFPATSPYVVAVGGTQPPKVSLPMTTNFKEQACQSSTGGVITTGGGFSTYW
jgi:tripeptidyl-peptidase-1